MIDEVLNYRYKIISKVSDEGLYTVYKCEDLIASVSVMANIINPSYTSNKSLISQIMGNAEELKRLYHPGIAKTIDYYSSNDINYVITESIHGVSLDDHIKNNTSFEPSTAIDICNAVSSIMNFIHSQGIVHGNLSPSNIMVTQDGHIKITNLWLEGVNKSKNAVRYMAPEVIDGEQPSYASDIYSIGVLLFQLLTGKTPYDGETAELIAEKHRNEEALLLRAYRPSLSRDLESIILKAMQKSPANRYKTVKALISDLSAVKYKLHSSLTQSEQQKSPPPIVETDEEEFIDYDDTPVLSTIRRVLLIIALIGIVAAFGIGAYIYTRPNDVVVPDLLGKTYSEAMEIASKSDILVSIKMEETNEEYPIGTIYFTKPIAGRTTKRGNTVEVWISKGSKYAVVPAVTNIPLAEAQNKIRSAGLVVGELSEENDDKIPLGYVISQDPKPDAKLERNSEVKLVYSLGPIVESTTDNFTENAEISPGAQDSSAALRTFEIKFTVPEGNQSQNVEIAVADDYGENIVFTKVSSPAKPLNRL